MAKTALLGAGFAQRGLGFPNRGLGFPNRAPGFPNRGSGFANRAPDVVIPTVWLGYAINQRSVINHE